MPARIVVVGGGIGGLLTANLLAKRLDQSQAAITLVDATGMHVFQPGWLYVALDKANARWLARDTRSLLRREVRLVIDQASHIDTTHRRVDLARGDRLGFDYLVVATGAALARDEIPGLRLGAHDFYSSAGAERLREALRGFKGGNLVVSVPSMPFKCPPAPVEFTLLVDELLRKRGVRDRTRIIYVSPLDHVFPIASVAGLIDDLYLKRGIDARLGFELERIEKNLLISTTGEQQPFDLAVSIPPNRGAPIARASGLGNEKGWIPADPRTLAVRGTDDIYVVGDASDLPTSKNGSTAHFEAPRVTEQIVAAVEGRIPNPVRSRYRGLVICPLEVGGGKATVLAFDYDRPPRPLRPNRFWHAATWIFNRTYWFTVKNGRL
ncbi:MAG: NAD(P)/FAD-dependent oxidoreductase [Acidimicrobiia bacterium]